MNGEQIKKANQLIDLLEDSVREIDWFSADNDDCFNYEVSKLEELVKSLRRNLPKEKVHTEYFTTNMGEVNEITIQ